MTRNYVAEFAERLTTAQRRGVIAQAVKAVEVDPSNDNLATMLAWAIAATVLDVVYAERELFERAGIDIGDAP